MTITRWLQNASETRLCRVQKLMSEAKTLNLLQMKALLNNNVIPIVLDQSPKASG